MAFGTKKSVAPSFSERMASIKSMFKTALTLSGTSALVIRYPDNQCWVLLTNTSTWKGHAFSDDTKALFEKLRKKFGGRMPKRDLFV